MTGTNNTRYIIREVYQPDFENYFDCDCFSAAAGDYCYNVFPIYADYRGYFANYYSSINKEDFEQIEKEYNNITNEVNELENGWNGYKNIKEIMTDYNLTYNPHKAHILKEISASYDLDGLTRYLTIKTGEKWACILVTGYCQGDFVNVIYCEKFYTEKDARRVGEMILGCAKEFSITFIEAGEEQETVYGYFVADCEAWKDEDYKKIVCGYEGIDPEKDNVTLEMIENVQTITQPVYRTA